MKLTPAEANKLVKKIHGDRQRLLKMERQCRTYIAATIEKKEEARPEYDYTAAQKELAALDEKIRRIKHAINVFNATHFVEGFDMTADQMLVYIPQLTERKEKLREMALILAKERVSSSSIGNLIEYEYANFDPEQANRDLNAVTEELIRAQLSLDRFNASEVIDIDI